MSHETRPISSAQFSLAIQDLPLENLYAKAKEIENSIAHLERSNRQLQEYSDSIKRDETLGGEVKEEVGDRECLEAIRENAVVVQRQTERVGLLRAEVERRGGGWHDGGGGGGENGESGEGSSNGNGNGGRGSTRPRLTDEEIRRRMAERMDGVGDGDGEDGMHL